MLDADELDASNLLSERLGWRARIHRLLNGRHNERMRYSNERACIGYNLGQRNDSGRQFHSLTQLRAERLLAGLVMVVLGLLVGLILSQLGIPSLGAHRLRSFTGIHFAIFDNDGGTALAEQRELTAIAGPDVGYHRHQHNRQDVHCGRHIMNSKPAVTYRFNRELSEFAIRVRTVNAEEPRQARRQQPSQPAQGTNPPLICNTKS